MRTVLGLNAAYNSSKTPYLEGDDISENTFLLSNGRALRFEHKNLAFIEYGPSVTRAIEAAHLAVEAYTRKALSAPKFPSISPQDPKATADLLVNGEFGTKYCPVKRD